MSVQVHRVRLRLGKIPYAVVKRADMPHWWSFDFDWCIVCVGSARPIGKARRQWGHDGWYSFITPDGAEHTFLTGKNKSRYSVLLREAKRIPQHEFWDRMFPNRRDDSMILGIRRRGAITVPFNWSQSAKP